MTSTTSEKLAAAKSAVNKAQFHLRAAWVNTYGLRADLAVHEQSLAAGFAAHNNPDPLDLVNTANHASLAARHGSADYIAVRGCLDLLEASADFLEADKVVTPLVANVRELEAQLADENRAEAQRLHAIRNRKAEALAEAAAKIEAEFAQPEPEPAPEPPAPFRGRVKIAATA